MGFVISRCHHSGGAVEACYFSASVSKPTIGASAFPPMYYFIYPIVPLRFYGVQAAYAYYYGVVGS